MKKKTIKIRSVFIRSTVAQYELFVRCMRFTTMRKQVHSCFYQFDFQSGTRLVKNVSSKSSIFSIFSPSKWNSKYSTMIYNDLT